MAELFQFGLEYLPVVSLDLDDPVFHCSAASAFLFELLGQLRQFHGIKGQSAHERHPLSFATFGLARNINRTA